MMSDVFDPLFEHIGYNEMEIMARFVRFPLGENVRIAVLRKKLGEMMKDPPRIGDVGPIDRSAQRRSRVGRPSTPAWEVAYLFACASKSYDAMFLSNGDLSLSSRDRILSRLLQVQDVPAAIQALDEAPFLVLLWNEGYRLEGDVSPGLSFAMFLRRWFELASQASSPLIRENIRHTRQLMTFIDRLPARWRWFRRNWRLFSANMRQTAWSRNADGEVVPVVSSVEMNNLLFVVCEVNLFGRTPMFWLRHNGV